MVRTAMAMAMAMAVTVRADLPCLQGCWQSLPSQPGAQEQEPSEGSQ